MIVTKLLGGLGNQMFQYAAGFAVAEKNKTDLAVDISWYKNSNSIVWTMDYALGVFNISGKTITDKDYTARTDKLTLREKLNNKVLKEYKEKSLLYDPTVLQNGNKLALEGYWQSEKYFLPVRDKILKEFSFKNPFSGHITALAKNIKNNNAVSLHIRRGDYANHAKTNEVHGLTSLDFYKESIDYIRKNNSEIKIFVFSDDPDWCKQNLKFNSETVFISDNQGYEDMYLMSLCKHNITANSSFSWWGAWLNTNPDKIVIAPKKWFNDKTLDSSDIVPESWVKL